VTSADLHLVVNNLPRVHNRAGSVLKLLVVSADECYCAGIDLSSGALVRGWSPRPLEERVEPYDVVEVTLDDHMDAVPDPAEPEAVGLIGPPRHIGRMSGRHRERLLRPLLHPENQPLLLVSATFIPFWERAATHPSIAVVEPEGRIMLRRKGSYLGCRFGWQGHERELPCLDRAVAGQMDRTGRAWMIAGRGDRLIVAFTAPIEGRCHKVVETVLPRP